jgi:hypothetical protein
MKGAVSGDSARHDFAVLGDKRLHHANIFVIEQEVLIRAESADFFAMKSTAAASTATAAATAAIVSVLVAAIHTIFATLAFVSSASIAFIECHKIESPLVN